MRLSIVLAPFTPFLSEELYKKLTGGESVHLLNWPKAGIVNDKVVHDMSIVRAAITEGLSVRAQASIKVRQPLSRATVPHIPENYKEIITEELNVKEVVFSDSVDTVQLDVTLTDTLRKEGLARELIRFIQSARKKAGLDIDDRINLLLQTKSSDITEAIQLFSDVIQHETLSMFVEQISPEHFSEEVHIEGHTLKIGIRKK